MSPVRVFVLVGGLLGCLSGFALPIYTVLDWPLITGGMPLISIPPFVVIAFELTILFAGRSHMVNATTPLVSQMVSSSQEFVEAGH